MNPVNNTTPCLIISKESKKIKLKENDWLGLIPQCTEVRFASFFSGGFITALVQYSKKATKFCEIFPAVCTVVKSKGKISQKFVASSEYMNFNQAWNGQSNWFLSGTFPPSSSLKKNDGFLPA